MKLAGALVLLGAALLLTSEGDCGICPAIKADVHLFLYGTPEEYTDYVKTYNDDPLVVENTKKLKICIDRKLTEEDKANATTFIEKVDVSPIC
ncbi:major allergen I polypeptide chain 1-like [Apodemus sylvaticus]|uniref:major allergen I polypeptide chain 1-like n=1 Tax=Apodemus sylvaticus TaxID=10129 RepID=UPI002241A62B|nr:major allergen I polypeptide chain 1-like [Apodemus sylvaticus]